MQYKVGQKKLTVVQQKIPHLQERLFASSAVSVVHVHLATSWPVMTLWVLLSFLVSTLATMAYVHPEWFIRTDYNHTDLLRYDRTGLLSTLGMVSVCYRDGENGRRYRSELECHDFDEDFPSSTWQTAYVLFGSGCVLLTWCSILAFSNIWIVGHKNRHLFATFIGRIQLVAVVLLMASLLLYPLVLGSPFARLYCGIKAEIYYPAACSLGWAYIAAITATVLACYCPLLAHFTHYNVFSPCYWTDI